MKPRKPLKRSTKPLTRTARLRSRKADPKKRRFAKRRCEAYLEYLRHQPCQMTGVVPWVEWVEPAHIKTRGSGGYDLYNALSLSWWLHREQEGRTKDFEKKYGVNLRELAAKQTEEFLDLFPQYRKVA